MTFKFRLDKLKRIFDYINNLDFWIYMNKIDDTKSDCVIFLLRQLQKALDCNEYYKKKYETCKESKVSRSRVPEWWVEEMF